MGSGGGKNTPIPCPFDSFRFSVKSPSSNGGRCLAIQDRINNRHIGLGAFMIGLFDDERRGIPRRFQKPDGIRYIGIKEAYSGILRGCLQRPVDRKSTRLNSSHANISYAVFCLKKKNPILILFII